MFLTGVNKNRDKWQVARNAGDFVIDGVDMMTLLFLSIYLHISQIILNTHTHTHTHTHTYLYIARAKDIQLFRNTNTCLSPNPSPQEMGTDFAGARTELFQQGRETDYSPQGMDIFHTSYLRLHTSYFLHHNSYFKKNNRRNVEAGGGMPERGMRHDISFAVRNIFDNRRGTTTSNKNVGRISKSQKSRNNF
jgi:hypothetical protein